MISEGREYTMKKVLLIMVAVFFVTGMAFADPILLPTDQPLRIQFDNIEQLDTTGSNSIVVPGGYGTAGNWGVLKVSNIAISAVITDHTLIGGAGLHIFDDGTQGQVTGLFYDIDITGTNTATGGVLDLYWNDVGDNVVTATCLAGTTCAPDAATVTLFTSGTFLGRLFFDSGIVSGDFVTTLTSDISVIGSVSGEGHANGFLSVDTSTVGDWTNALNGDWFFVHSDTATRDVRFRNTFNLDPNWDGAAESGIIGLSSTDPATVFTATAVPEPGTLTLLGLGLGGLAVLGRRKSLRR
jgi:hypothetical protein